MMSSHINSMLEHLRIKKPARPAVVPAVRSPDDDRNAPATTAATEPVQCPAAVRDQTPPVTAAVNGQNGTVRRVTDADVCDHAVAKLTNVLPLQATPDKRAAARVCPIDLTGNFDPKKRFSIPAVCMASVDQPAAANGNGTAAAAVEHALPVRQRRDLSPSHGGGRPMTRKMSQDMRALRGSAANLSDEAFELARIRRPVKVKSILTNFETFDSLHARATEVSDVCVISLCDIPKCCVCVCVCFLDCLSTRVCIECVF